MADVVRTLTSPVAQRALLTILSWSLARPHPTARRQHGPAKPASPGMPHLFLFREQEALHSETPSIVPCLPRVKLAGALPASPAPVPPKAPHLFRLSYAPPSCVNTLGGFAPARLLETTEPLAGPRGKQSEACRANVCNPLLLFSKTSTHVSCGYQLVSGLTPRHSPVNHPIHTVDDSLRRVISSQMVGVVFHPIRRFDRTCDTPSPPLRSGTRKHRCSGLVKNSSHCIPVTDPAFPVRECLPLAGTPRGLRRAKTCRLVADHSTLHRQHRCLWLDGLHTRDRSPPVLQTTRYHLSTSATHHDPRTHPRGLGPLLWLLEALSKAPQTPNGGCFGWGSSTQEHPCAFPLSKTSTYQIVTVLHYQQRECSWRSQPGQDRDSGDPPRKGSLSSGQVPSTNRVLRRATVGMRPNQYCLRSGSRLGFGDAFVTTTPCRA